jgi:exosortase/archaeosortase family protein
MLRVAAFACLALAVWVTCDLFHWWSLREDYSFGYLVPIFCGYVLYDRWPRIAALFSGGATAPDARSVRWIDRLAFAFFFFAATVFVMGVIIRAVSGVSLPGSFFMTFGFSGIALSAAALFSDRRADGAPLSAGARREFIGLMVFPALVWIISAPLMGSVENAVSLFLLNRVTAIDFTMFDILGFAIERHGNVLEMPMGQVGVEEACSGIRSLTGCLFAGSFLAAVFLDRFWKKAALVVAAMLLAFVTNVIRSLILTGWAYAYGSQSIEGRVHDVTGYAVLGVTVLLLLCLIPIFNYKPRLDSPESAPGSGGDGRAGDVGRPE